MYFYVLERSDEIESVPGADGLDWRAMMQSQEKESFDRGDDADYGYGAKSQLGRDYYGGGGGGLGGATGSKYADDDDDIGSSKELDDDSFDRGAKGWQRG